MKKHTLIISIFGLLMLAGCGNNSNEQGTGKSDAVPTIVEVEILLPESIEPNDDVKIEALVTQGEEKVDDATEVKFEVWKQGQEKDHEMLEGNNDGSGIYSITKTFDEEGFYYVVAHTTARNMHVMPREEIKVGNPDPSSSEEVETGHNHGSVHEDHEGHEHEHETTLVMALEKSESVRVEEETTLSAEIKQEKGALTDADVRFEVWYEDSEMHEYIDASEVSEGLYEAKTTFKEAGLHNIQIHVEKDELHEHKLVVLEVE